MSYRDWSDKEHADFLAEHPAMRACAHKDCHLPVWRESGYHFMPLVFECEHLEKVRHRQEAAIAILPIVFLIVLFLPELVWLFRHL